MFCWHNWNKWSDPVNGVMGECTAIVGHFAVMQMRTCAKCGVAETRTLPKLRSVESLKSER